MPLRSNSFNFEPVRDVMRPRGAVCPLASGAGLVPGAPDPDRAVFLRLKDRMRLFATRTGDFDDCEIPRTKALAQASVDRSQYRWTDDCRDYRASLTPATPPVPA